MKRRTFIAGLGSAATWPLVARAQQPPRLRRIGVLLSLPPDDPILPARVTAFAQALQELGWTDGRNMGIDYRFAGSDPDRIRRFGLELAALEPDLLVAEGAIVTHVLQQAAPTVPIVFVLASDPVGEGLVTSLARPGGNTTGFALWEYGIGVNLNGCSCSKRSHRTSRERRSFAIALRPHKPGNSAPCRAWHRCSGCN